MKASYPGVPPLNQAVTLGSHLRIIPSIKDDFQFRTHEYFYTSKGSKYFFHYCKQDCSSKYPECAKLGWVYYLLINIVFGFTFSEEEFVVSSFKS